MFVIFLIFLPLCAMEDIEKVKERIFKIKFIEPKSMGTKQERMYGFSSWFNELSLIERCQVVNNHWWMDQETGRIRKEFYDFTYTEFQSMWSLLNLQDIPTKDVR